MSYSEEDPYETATRVFLDVTTMITLTSDITNDLPMAQHLFISKEVQDSDKECYRQIKDETDNPTMTKLRNQIKDKEMLTTKSAAEKFNQIILRSGSVTEKVRMEELLKDVTKLPDDPIDLFDEFKGKIWTPLNRSLFGTAYRNREKSIMLTGNRRVVVQMYDYDFTDLPCVVHKSRKFLGDKYDTEIYKYQKCLKN